MKHVPRLASDRERQAQERERSQLTRRELATQIRQMQEARAGQENENR